VISDAAQMWIIEVTVLVKQLGFVHSSTKCINLSIDRFKVQSHDTEEVQQEVVGIRGQSISDHRNVSNQLQRVDQHPC